MEPVFMVTSQSTATAPCLAIDSGTSVHDLDYKKPHERLVADCRVLAPKSAP